MAGNTAEVIARLRLSADKFSADSVKAWSDFEARGEKAGSSIKTSIGRALSEVAASAKVALQLPTLDSGQINLNTQALRNRADAARQEAIVLREVATAAERAANSQDRATDEARAYAVASSQLAQKAEEHASALRREADALDRVQAELGQTARSSAVFGTQQKAVNDNARTNQLAMRNLGYQISDVGASLASGGNLFQIFGQQVGQVGGALSDMTGKAGALGRFLTNPWVAALTTAGIVAGMLASRIGESADAAKNADQAAQKYAEQLDFLKIAHDKLAEAIDQQVKAAREANKVSAASEIAARNAAQAKLNEAIATEKLREADLRRQRDELRRRDSAIGGGDPMTGDVNRAQSALAIQQAERDLEDARRAIKGLQDVLLQKGITVATSEARAAGDPVAAENRRRDLAEAELKREVERGTISVEKYRAELEKLNRTSRETIDRIQRENSARSTGGTSATDDATVAQVRSILVGAFGGVVTSTTGGRHVPGSDHYKGRAIDFVPAGGVGSITKTEIRAVLEEAGLQVKRNAAGVEQLFGPGDRGHKNHWHVAWEGGKGAIDSARVAERIAEQRQRQDEALTRSADALIKKYDESEAALRDYVDQLRQIDEAVAGGKLTPEQGDLLRNEASRRARQADEQRQQEVRDRELKRIMSTVPDSAAEFSDELERGARALEESLNSGVAVMSGFFGRDLASLLKRAADQSLGPNQNSASVFLSSIGSARKDAYDEIGRELGNGFEKVLGKKLAGSVGNTIGTAYAGYEVAGGINSLLLGSKAQSKGSQIGTGLGSLAGAAVGGPIGSVIGGIIGGTIGGLFSKTKKASSTLSLVDGEVVAGDARGNSGSYRSNANKLGGGVSDVLNDIAHRLDGELGGRLSVSIGQRKKNFVVDPTGQGRTKGAGVLSFKDEQDAVEAAIRDALSDGVLQGISAASQRILKSGKDLDRALQKAVTIESIPKELKRRLDPVGFAIDEVTKRFADIRKTLLEAGGSAEQMAEAQKLYNLELADAKASAGGAADSLKDFLQSLKAGSGSYLSLTDQETNARAALQPYLDQIGRGESIDQQKYLEASQTFLDIERELYGSTSKFFDALSEIQAATGKAISTIDNAAPIRTTSDPFIQETAQAAKATAASASNLQTLMAQAVGLLDQIASQGGGTVNDWLAQQRGFA